MGLEGFMCVLKLLWGEVLLLYFIEGGLRYKEIKEFVTQKLP